MENTPGVLFWVLAVITVATAIFSVTAKRAIHVAIALVLFILSMLNLLIALGFLGLAFICGFMSLIVIAVLAYALKKSLKSKLFAFGFTSVKKQSFYFVISMLFFIGCLFLVTETDVWQYASEFNSLSFIQLLNTLREFYLLPFMLFKSFLLLILIVVIFNLKRKAA